MIDTAIFRVCVREMRLRTRRESPVFFSSTSLSNKKSRGGVRACVLYALSDIYRVSRCMSLSVSRAVARVFLHLSLSTSRGFHCRAVCGPCVCPVPLRLAALPVPLIHSK